MKKLPNIYKNEINKKITNNNTVYYCTPKKDFLEENLENPLVFLENLFKEKGYIFNKPLIIKTKDKEFDTAIVRKTDRYIYTLTDDIILIDNIISIRKK